MSLAIILVSDYFKAHPKYHLSQQSAAFNDSRQRGAPRTSKQVSKRLTPASDVASRHRMRYANRHQLIVPRCRLNTYCRRVFPIAGPTVWNSLPGELRDPACGFDSFKQFLKTILFSLY